jgi:methyl-accepting chemotaxis protein
VQIEDQLQQAYQIPLGMAAAEGSMAQPDQRLSRPQVELLLGSRLRQANGISSIYAQFEPNGYDEQDADWQTGASHSVAGKGSLEVYQPGTERKHRAADHRCRHQ